MGDRRKATHADRLDSSILTNAVEELEASRGGFHRGMIQEPTLETLFPEGAEHVAIRRPDPSSRRKFP